ncbi:unnamed protein product, partial [Mesorhabditis spiculigera]
MLHLPVDLYVCCRVLVEIRPVALKALYSSANMPRLEKLCKAWNVQLDFPPGGAQPVQHLQFSGSIAAILRARKFVMGTLPVCLQFEQAPATSALDYTAIEACHAVSIQAKSRLGQGGEQVNFSIRAAEEQMRRLHHFRDHSLGAGIIRRSRLGMLPLSPDPENSPIAHSLLTGAKHINGDSQLWSGQPSARRASREQMLFKAHQAISDTIGTSTRYPTDLWAGYGFSNSLPTDLLKGMIDLKMAAGADGANGHMAPSTSIKGLAAVREEEEDSSLSASSSSLSNTFSTRVFQKKQKLPAFSASTSIFESPLGASESAWDVSLFTEPAMVLAQLGLGEYTANLREQEIDMDAFLLLDEAALRDIGVATVGARKKIHHAILKLRESAKAQGYSLRAAKFGKVMSSGSPLWSLGSIRLRVALLILAALSIEGLMRSNLNMAMVCMLNSTVLAQERAQKFIMIGNVSHQVDDCPILEIGNRKPMEHRGTFDWSSQERAVLFAMFYVGGLVAALTTEPLTRRYGPKTVVMWGALVNVVGTFATPPTAAHFGAIPLFVVRFVMGFGQGVLYPCMAVLVAHWFPAGEKSTAVAITTTGNQVSVVVALFLTAELCQLPWMDGWPFAFHLYGVIGALFCASWWWGVSDHPSTNPYISAVEKAHIDEGRKSNPHTEKPRWGVLLKSPLIWSLAACSLCHNFITVGTVTYLPLYYRTVLNMSLTSNGIFSALPFVAQFFSKVAFASFADEAKKRKWMSITAATKICNSMASFGIGFCFLGLCFFDCQLRGWAIAAVFGAMIFVSGYVPGYNTSVVCVAPSQTAAIASFTRFWGQVGSSVAPYMIGALAKTGTLDEWKHVFATIVFLCFSSGIFFQIVGSASIQDWDTSAQCTEMKLIEAKPEPEKVAEPQNPEAVPLDDPKLQSTT